MRVTFHQLKVFEAVARRGSFTRAAEELFLTQPTISVQIKQLSEEVGIPLFEQIGKKIYLTEAGRILYQTCKEVDEVWRRLEMQINDLRGVKRGNLRIAVVNTAKYIIPRLLGPFCAQYPGIDFKLAVLNRDRVIERLTTNEDDLYIMTMPPEHLDVQMYSFLDNPLLVVAPLNHPLAKEKHIPLKKLASERFIIREEGSGTRLQVERFFAEHRIKLNVRMEIGTNEAIKHAVAGGLGIAVLSQHSMTVDDMHRELAILNVQGFPIHSKWYVVYPTGKMLSIVAKTFFEYLSEATKTLKDSGVTSKNRAKAR